MIYEKFTHKILHYTVEVTYSMIYLSDATKFHLHFK